MSRPLLDEPAVTSEHNGLGPGIHVELAEDARQVVPDGLFADEDAHGDFGIAAREMAENVELSRRELSKVTPLRAGSPCGAFCLKVS